MKTKQQEFPSLSKALGVSGVYLKREDLHTYGSHKGRSIPLMIKTYAKEGKTHFAISSSGNAALAAVLATNAHNQNNPEKQIHLTVFVGKQIETKKLDFIKKHIITDQITLEQVDRPKQEAFQLEKTGDTVNLRQSTDDTALVGYEDLAVELSKIPNLKAVFIPTSSGTTAQGIGQVFQQLKLPIQLHIVQTPACHPIADALGAEQVDASTSIAGAIVDKVAHRKQAVVDLVQTSNGAGWIVSDRDIETACKLTKEKTGVAISYNSALSVAGLQKAIAHGFSWDGPVAVLICGR